MSLLPCRGEENLCATIKDAQVSKLNLLIPKTLWGPSSSRLCKLRIVLIDRICDARCSSVLHRSLFQHWTARHGT